MNSHGRLKTKTGEVRGLRLWCSSRRKGRPGCGRSFSIWLCSVIPRHSVGADTLSEFLAFWSRSGGNVLAAWERAKTGFSTDSAYRWVKGLIRNQGEVRTRLSRVRAPPLPAKGDVLADLFEHLAEVLESPHFIKTFQLRFQQPWPMR